MRSKLKTPGHAERRRLAARVLSVVVGGLLVLAAEALTTEARGADIPGGKAMVGSRCTSCHSVTGPAPDTFQAVLKRKAPDLFYAGSKFNRSWLVAWLQAPTPIRPAGVMYLNHVVSEDGTAT